MYFIIGLGNPGTQYDGTRHNIGRAVVEHVHEQWRGSEWTRDKLASATRAEASFNDESALLVLPETFMNRSGDTVAYLARTHEAASSQMIIVHDDVDLPLGTVRIGKGRGSGGHNGLASIIAALNSKDFVRIRIGIAPRSFWTGKVKRPAVGGSLERFVLGRFSRSERSVVTETIPRACAAIEAVITVGVEKAMNEYNRE